MNPTIAKSRISRTDTRALLYIGVQILVMQNNHILLVKRRSEFYNHHWCLPSGSLQMGETVFQCASRKLYGETGLISQDMQLFDCVLQEEGDSYIHIAVRTLRYEGTMSNNDPEHCSDMAFFAIEQLPTPIVFTSLAFINKVSLSQA
jgi:8-oxo-dGTP diphosphatase